MMQQVWLVERNWWKEDREIVGLFVSFNAVKTEFPEKEWIGPDESDHWGQGSYYCGDNSKFAEDPHEPGAFLTAIPYEVRGE